MGDEAILIHSPLVGPDFWQPVASVLERAGVVCSVPTAPAATAWRDWPAALCDGLEVQAGATVVGHSAAGFMLPAIADAIGARALIFVDALIPPASGRVPPADSDFLQFVSSLPTQDGRLPIWSRWWGEGAIERVIGDAAAFQRFEAGLPRLSRAWFDDELDVPAWAELAAAYLQTSERFAPTAAEAARRGWPVRVLDGTHLSPFVEPDEVARALLELMTGLADAGAG